MLTGFLHDLGYPATGGGNGTLRAFRTEVDALFARRTEIGT
jgi:hypothetical protein